MNRAKESAEARRDVLETYHFIALDSQAAADRWLETILDRYETLVTFPLAGRARPELRPDLRSYSVGRYLIFYKATDEGVEILRVVHGSRDLESIDF